MSGVPTPRRRAARSRGDVREAALLKAAEQLLFDGKFWDASIADIVRDAGISRQTFYFYYASKEALLERLIQTRLADLSERHFTQTRQPHESAAEEIRDTMHSAADMWVEHGVVLSVASELAGSVPSVFDLISSLVEGAVEQRAQLLFDAGSAPEVADPESAKKLTTDLLWMTERCFYVVWRKTHSAEELHAAADRMYAIWVRTAGLDTA